MLAVKTDVADGTLVASAFAATRESFGRIDVLFNNAGAFAAGRPVDEIELAEWKRVVDVHLTGAFLCAREAIRMMKTQSPEGMTLMAQTCRTSDVGDGIENPPPRDGSRRRVASQTLAVPR